MDYQIEVWDDEAGQWTLRGDWGSEAAHGPDLGELQDCVFHLAGQWPGNDWRIVDSDGYEVFREIGSLQNEA